MILKTTQKKSVRRKKGIGKLSPIGFIASVALQGLTMQAQLPVPQP